MIQPCFPQGELPKVLKGCKGAVLSPSIARAGPGGGLADWAGLYVAAMRGPTPGPFTAVASLGDAGDWLLFRRVPERTAQTASPTASSD